MTKRNRSTYESHIDNNANNSTSSTYNLIETPPSAKRLKQSINYTKYSAPTTTAISQVTSNNLIGEANVVNALTNSVTMLTTNNAILSLNLYSAAQNNADKDALILALYASILNQQDKTVKLEEELNSLGNINSQLQRESSNQKLVIENLKNINSRLQHELSNKDLVVEKTKYNEKKIQKLNENTEEEKQQLTIEINLLKKQSNQINKHDIIDFLTKVTGVSLSDKTLVDINLTERTFVILGREKVSGTSQQGRHIIAHAFLTEALKESIRIYDNPENLFKRLTEIFLIFCNYKNGLCLTEEQYLKLKLHGNIYSKKIITNKNIFYFVDRGKEYWVPCKDIGIDEEQANELYQKKYKKLITYYLNELYQNINDTNTLIITCEILTKFIYFTFNKDNLVSYSEAGNSLNYEIHLYKNLAHALNNKNKPYEIISHKQAFDQKNDISEKIRISFNEGNVVKHSKAALRLINEIIKNDQDFINNEATIKEFNDKFNKPLVLENLNVDLSLYNNRIKLDNIETKIIYQICKYLYFSFDFKPLEENVLVSTSQKTNIKGFYGASTKDKSYFTFENGKNFRDQERKNYSGKIPYRKEKVDKETLATKIVDYANLTLLSYSSFSNAFNDDNFGYKIVKELSKLISLAYDLGDSLFRDFVKSKIHGGTSKCDSTDNVNNGSVIEQTFFNDDGQDADIITILGLSEDN